MTGEVEPRFKQPPAEPKPRKRLERRTRLRGRAEIKRSGRLSPVSRRRQERRGMRRDAVAEAMRVEGAGCWMHGAPGRYPACFGTVAGHELIGRYAWPDGIYCSWNIVPLCTVHNEWVESNHTQALAIGLRIPGEADREWNTFEEAARLRAAEKATWT